MGARYRARRTKAPSPPLLPSNQGEADVDADSGQGRALRDVVLGRVFVRAADSLAERPRMNTPMLPSDKVLL